MEPAGPGLPGSGRRPNLPKGTAMTNTTATLVRRLSLGLGETRRELGLSRASVAQMAGVSRSTVENVEHGKASARSMVLVATALIAWNMFSGPVEPKPELPVLEPVPFAWPELPEDRMFGRAS
jgi:DNA-binding XRE family transcriptional regulator